MGSTSSTSTTTRQQTTGNQSGTSQLHAAGNEYVMGTIPKMAWTGYENTIWPALGSVGTYQNIINYGTSGAGMGEGKPYLGSAANMLSNAAASVPGTSQQGLNYLNTGANMLGQGANWLQGTGVLGMNQLAPIAQGQFLDQNNPTLQNLLNTVQNRVSNQVGSQFAGAGRDFSGAYANAMGQGIGSALAEPLFQGYQFERSQQQAAIDAMNQLGMGVGTGMGQLGGALGGLGVDYSNVGSQTANTYGNLANAYMGLTGAYDTTALNSYNSMLAAAGLIPEMLNAPYIPAQNYANLLMPYATAFGENEWKQQSSENMNQQQRSKTSTGFSDRRLKEDIEQVGALFDGTPVYRFRFKGQKNILVGLMADDVEKRIPEAVKEGALGFKTVDFKLATDASVRK